MGLSYVMFFIMWNNIQWNLFCSFFFKMIVNLSFLSFFQHNQNNLFYLLNWEYWHNSTIVNESCRYSHPQHSRTRPDLKSFVVVVGPSKSNLWFRHFFKAKRENLNNMKEKNIFCSLNILLSYIQFLCFFI